jgi:hypothetical protein
VDCPSFALHTAMFFCACCYPERERFALHKDHRGVDLISDVLPFGRLWYGEPNAASHASSYPKFYSRSHECRDPRLRWRWQRDPDTRHKGDFKEP